METSVQGCPSSNFAKQYKISPAQRIFIAKICQLHNGSIDSLCNCVRLGCVHQNIQDKISDMNLDAFWDLIKKSRRGATEDCDQLAENLIARLEKLDPTEIASFHQHLWDLLGDSYRRNLWAVAYIINGGCSNDGFEYFRCWLISQGREFFAQVLAEPERAARRVKDEEVECEPILYAALQAYENKTGQEMPKIEISHPEEPKGESWKEEDLERLYPKLCKRFA